jgi:hypothetical protein
MNPIRMLAAAPAFALLSCSAAIWNTSRDPAGLVGRSRPSIHAELGKPARTDTWINGEPIDYILVKGSWKYPGIALAHGFVDVLTLGILEPLHSVQSAARKSAATSQGQFLELYYHSGTVSKARATLPD